MQLLRRITFANESVVIAVRRSRLATGEIPWKTQPEPGLKGHYPSIYLDTWNAFARKKDSNGTLLVSEAALERFIDALASAAIETKAPALLMAKLCSTMQEVQGGGTVLSRNG